MKYDHYVVCKENSYNCSECIYHEHVYDGAVFRGTRCLYREAEVMKALKGGENHGKSHYKENPSQQIQS